MTKYYLLLVILLFTILNQCQATNFPISAGCKTINMNCTSATQCCSGHCQNAKCVNLCKIVHESCNKSSDVCCPWSQCRQSDKKCCRLGAQDSSTPSECCNPEKWKAKQNSPGGRCCSEHAHFCVDNSDCCGTALCQTTPSTSTKICI